MVCEGGASFLTKSHHLVKKNQSKPGLLLPNTQTKTALLDKEKNNKLCQMIACFTSAMLQSRLYQVGIKRTKQKKKNSNELCALYNFPGQFPQVNCFE